MKDKNLEEIWNELENAERKYILRYVDFYERKYINASKWGDRRPPSMDHQIYIKISKLIGREPISIYL
jgi:hypothetical protein